MLVIRLNDDERALIETAAEAIDSPVSTFIRESAIERATRIKRRG